MLGIIHTVALIGIEARPVRLEASAGQGVPGMRIVGLGDTAVREASDRVHSAIKRSKLEYPGGRVVVNLSPADLKKTGTGFDLPMALAILAAHVPESSGEAPLPGQEKPKEPKGPNLTPRMLRGVWALGELGLDGQVRSVPGTLPAAAAARDAGAEVLLVSDHAAVEASLIDGLRVIPVESIGEAVAVLAGAASPRPIDDVPDVVMSTSKDLRDVRGQAVARRALEVAAAGGHHLLMSGPPGCGKTMLAERLPGLMPPLHVEEALEVATIHSVAGMRHPDAPLSLVPPFRAPHHTTSMAGLVGGGSGIPRPGELSLAHRGVLFIDELLEAPRSVLDVLRQPLENGEVRLVRSQHAVTYPSQVILVAATNPCPCGDLGHPTRRCRCGRAAVDRYRQRLSGPLADRIDLQVELRPVERDQLLAAPEGEPTPVVAARVRAARELAEARWGPGRTNRSARGEAVRATVADDAIRALGRAVDALGMSARTFDRALRVGRTIADLDGREQVSVDDVEEAIAYRLPVTVPVA